MHALRHVHSLLARGGTVVDIHPVTEEQVESSEGVVGVIREPDWVNVDLPNSEAALRQTIAEGLYELEEETDYDVLQHFDESEDLIEEKRDLLEGQVKIFPGSHFLFQFHAFPLGGIVTASLPVFLTQREPFEPRAVANRSGVVHRVFR